VCLTGRPVRSDDFGAVPGTIADAARGTRIAACAGAPIIVDGDIWGAMSADAIEPAPLPDGIEARLAEFTELVATAVASALLEINPFDEPNVQQAKDATRVLLARHQSEGALPVAPPDRVLADGTTLTLTRAARAALGDRGPRDGVIFRRRLALVDRALGDPADEIVALGMNHRRGTLAPRYGEHVDELPVVEPDRVVGHVDF